MFIDSSNNTSAERSIADLYFGMNLDILPVILSHTSPAVVWRSRSVNKNFCKASFCSLIWKIFCQRNAFTMGVTDYRVHGSERSPYESLYMYKKGYPTIKHLFCENYSHSHIKFSYIMEFVQMLSIQSEGTYLQRKQQDETFCTQLHSHSDNFYKKVFTSQRPFHYFYPFRNEKLENMALILRDTERLQGVASVVRLGLGAEKAVVWTSEEWGDLRQGSGIDIAIFFNKDYVITHSNKENGLSISLLKNGKKVVSILEEEDETIQYVKTFSDTSNKLVVGYEGGQIIVYEVKNGMFTNMRHPIFEDHLYAMEVVNGTVICIGSSQGEPSVKILSCYGTQLREMNTVILPKHLINICTIKCIDSDHFFVLNDEDLYHIDFEKKEAKHLFPDRLVTCISNCDHLLIMGLIDEEGHSVFGIYDTLTGKSPKPDKLPVGPSRCISIECQYSSLFFSLELGDEIYSMVFTGRWEPPSYQQRALEEISGDKRQCPTEEDEEDPSNKRQRLNTG